jgi:hypothetical protein
MLNETRIVLTVLDNKQKLRIWGWKDDSRREKSNEYGRENPSHPKEIED